MRRTIRILCSAFALGLAVCLSPAVVYPVTLDDATLKGITTLKVQVESISPDVERDGLTKNQIQTDVEARLRNAGIAASAQAKERLYVNVSTLPVRRGLYSYSVLVMVQQSVYLVRDPAITAYGATTWFENTDGIASAAQLRDVQDAIGGLVDKFITAYLEQNPKR